MVIRVNSRVFTDVWLGNSDRLCMALQEHVTWAGELGIRTWPKESILNICPVWVSWFDSSTRTSSSLGWMYVTFQPMGQLDRTRFRLL
jgi:hypothetical protein